MGWLGDYLKKLAGAPPVELVFAKSIPAEDVPGIDGKVNPDSCYIELYLESLRLARARILAKTFNGLVYSFVSLPREGDQYAQLSAVSKPKNLAKVDPHSLNRVITVSKQMMGATAFRGNPVKLEFGLFSVVDRDLLSEAMDFVTKVSDTAGISYVAAIKPFLPLITQGMDLITGRTGDTMLEVGVDTDLTLTKGGVYAVIGVPKGSIDTTKLSLRKDGTLLLDGRPLEAVQVDGKRVDCAYATFSVRTTERKSDVFEIPELRDKYNAVMSAIRSNKEKDARDALVVFRLTALTSPDLISSDARYMANYVQQKVDEAFPPGAVMKVRPKVHLETFNEIGLYDTERRTKILGR